tara:strand:- start:448 stop:759 length:312 start_codon:yes stop_codon:yes gene_type:complete
MIKETTILTGSANTIKIYDSVDHFFTLNGLEDWRANELKLFTDAGFDVTDSAKQMVALSEDGTKVIITVAYADQAEKDAVSTDASTGDAPEGLIHELSEDHLF